MMEKERIFLFKKELIDGKVESSQDPLTDKFPEGIILGFSSGEKRQKSKSSIIVPVAIVLDQLSGRVVCVEPKDLEETEN